MLEFLLNIQTGFFKGNGKTPFFATGKQICGQQSECHKSKKEKNTKKD